MLINTSLNMDKKSYSCWESSALCLEVDVVSWCLKGNTWFQKVLISGFVLVIKSKTSF